METGTPAWSQRRRISAPLNRPIGSTNPSEHSVPSSPISFANASHSWTGIWPSTIAWKNDTGRQERFTRPLYWTPPPLMSHPIQDRVHLIELPLGPKRTVNTVLIEGDPLTLVDTGLKTP